VHTPASPVRPALVRMAPRLTALLAAGAFLAAAVAACGSATSSASATALYQTAIHQQCTAVAAVLSDGPDPDADPIGYAEAQILPLRRLAIADSALSKAVQKLAGAYQAYSVSTGAGNPAAAVQASKAEAAVNAICPGAAN
jgi:hypothetical protein